MISVGLIRVRTLNSSQNNKVMENCDYQYDLHITSEDILLLIVLISLFLWLCKIYLSQTVSPEVKCVKTSAILQTLNVT